MPLEAATFTDDLDVSNPTTNDPKSQGDDHLRLLKTTIKNSIKRVTRAFYVPSSVAKSANYAVVASDDNRTIVCDTTVAFTLTLPTLVASDAGWCVYVLKTTTDANPVWIAPPSGTINSFTKIRRSIENQLTKVLWTGSIFIATRPNAGAPIGSTIDFHGLSLPNGHLWPDGGTFVAADFVELNTVLVGNTKPDMKGRVGVGRDDMGGVAANRVTTAGSGVDGITMGSVGGAQNVVIAAGNVPQLAVSITDPGHDHDLPIGNGNFAGPGNPAALIDAAASGAKKAASRVTGITATANTGSANTALNKMPPARIVNKVLVAE